MVIGQSLEYGDECWAMCDGEPIAVGVFKAGELHPSRVFVRPEKGA
jgi:tRNA pseudouridine55 synthase